MSNSILKNSIQNALVHELKSQVLSYTRMLANIQESKNDDTKSSAGDKFETGREMMQVELDKTEMQLNKVNFSLEVLNQIKDRPKSKKVEIGSLVICNSGIYYLSIGHGRISIDGEKYYAISLASPIGQLLSLRSVGEKVVFNSRTIEILEIH